MFVMLSRPMIYEVCIKDFRIIKHKNKHLCDCTAAWSFSFCCYKGGNIISHTSTFTSCTERPNVNQFHPEN